MNNARAKAAFKRTQGGTVAPALPSPPAAATPQGTPSEVTPATKPFSGGEGSSQRSHASVQEKATGKRPAQTPQESRPFKKGGSKLSSQDLLVEIPSKSFVSPADRTRSKAASSPLASALQSHDLDVAVDFLEKMPNSPDRKHLNGMSQEDLYKSAALMLPKVDLILSRIVTNGLKNKDTRDLIRKLTAKEKQFEEMKTLWEGQEQELQENLRALQADYDKLTGEKLDLEGALKEQAENHIHEIDETLAREYQGWLKDLPHTEDGRILFRTFKEQFLASQEFQTLVDDKAMMFFVKGYNSCVAQFKSAGYPPEGSSKDFMNPEAAIDEAFPPAPAKDAPPALEGPTDPAAALPDKTETPAADAEETLPATDEEILSQ